MKSLVPMTLTVVGSIAFDSVKTPFGRGASGCSAEPPFTFLRRQLFH